jgi:CPA1 family monovalent cation:H+ antiporter
VESNILALEIYQIISVIIFLTAVFAYVNERWIKLPGTIGIMILAMFSSLLIVLVGNLIPTFSTEAHKLVANINFEQVLMKIMLGFLLFAGALHIDANKLKDEIWPVIILSTIGTFISTFLVSVMAYYLFQIFQFAIPYIYCLLFGALISPTDPIAVMGILKRVGIPKSLELKIAGESLFNDGVGVVIFLTILEIATNGMAKFSINSTALLFVKEAGGGIVFGGAIGYLAYFLIKAIDNYSVEVLITLTVVMCGYALADHLHLSGPLAIIIAGIIIGTKGKRKGFSEITRDHLLKFWDMLDEIFNAILFLLMGLEMLVIKIDPTVMLIGFIMIFVVLFARYICVFLPIAVLRFWIKFEKNAIAMLTWGGLRGGLSVAMALSLPEAMHRNEFVLITYLIVIFSITVQGLTIGKLAKKSN